MCVNHVAHCLHTIHVPHVPTVSSLFPTVPSSGINILCHVTLQFSSLETAWTSHPIGVGLGWHVTCSSQWNMGRRNNVSLISLTLRIMYFHSSHLCFCHCQGKDMPWEARWYQHNERLMEQTRTQPTAWSHAQQRSS